MPIADPGFAQSVSTGLQTGKALSTVNPLAVFIQHAMDRINAVQGIQLQAKGAGLGAEQQVLGQFRAYTSPEAQALRTRTMGIFGAGQPALEGYQGTASPPGISQPLTSPSGFQAQYGVTGGRVDPMTGFLTPEIGQTPESKMQQSIAEDVGKKIADVKVGSQILQSRLGLIEQALQKVPPLIPPQFPGSAIASSVIGTGRRFLGRADPNFRQTTTLIEGSIGPFLTTVEGLSRGRLTQGEINYLSNLLRDLPYLDSSGRQERLGLIRTILQGNMKFGESTQSSPFQPNNVSTKFSSQELGAEVRRRGLNL